MDESTVRKVVKEYLQKRNKKFRAKKASAAGPNILKNGTPLELKGSNFRKKGAYDQFARYAFEHEGLELAFPVDALSLSLLYSLYALERAIQHRNVNKELPLPLYLVLKVGEEKYLVRKFSSTEKIIEKLKKKLGQKALISIDAQPEKAMEEIKPIMGQVESKLLNVLEDEVESLGREISIE